MMIVGQILIVTICAYAFDRLNFPGKNVLFMGMLALMMVPGQIFIIPRFKLMVNLGLTNTCLLYTSCGDTGRPSPWCWLPSSW